ncbi:MAG: hypothetical protein WCB85_05015 [Candidatus Dormiibacterota bacterium]
MVSEHIRLRERRIIEIVGNAWPIVLDPVPDDFEPILSATDAWSRGSGGPSAELFLALYTGGSRRMLPGGGTEPVPDRVPAWVVVEPHVRRAVPGPFRLPPRREPNWFHGHSVTAVHAETGEVLVIWLIPGPWKGSFTEHQ